LRGGEFVGWIIISSTGGSLLVITPCGEILEVLM